MKFGKILTWHLLVGVPLAAFPHSDVQLAYDPAGFGWFPAHFLFGLGCGLPVLVPAYASQAGVFALLRRAGAGLLIQVVAGAAVQAGIVGAWAATVGVQPSLGGNFPMTPIMVGAAGAVGGLVAALNARLLPR